MIQIFLLLVISQTPQCDPVLWRHVYKPQRLKIVQPCVTVTGILKRCKPEPDGDLHCGLQLDPQFIPMLNARNIKGQQSQLVIEPICQTGKTTQASAIPFCKGFKFKLAIPKIGSHVSVTGPYVTDTEPGHGWNEIHAPSSITVIH